AACQGHDGSRYARLRLVAGSAALAPDLPDQGDRRPRRPRGASSRTPDLISRAPLVRSGRRRGYTRAGAAGEHEMSDITTELHEMGARARAAAAELAFAPSEAKANALRTAADVLWRDRAGVIAANAKDLDFGREKGLSSAMMDRLMLDEARIKGICAALV